MSKKGKKYLKLASSLDVSRVYPVDEACALLSGLQLAKFDESVEVAIKLGIDPRQSDQQVRGAVVLPNPLGKTVRVIVFAKAEKVSEAEGAGVAAVGQEDLVEKIQSGWMEFDKVVATPDMMPVVSRLGKLLGPKGMMPNPKLGTVTFDIAKAVEALKAGQVEFRVEKGAIVHAAIARVSFAAEKIKQNVEVLVEELKRLKPATSKGVYFKSASLSTTMGPGLKVDLSSFI